MSKEDMKKQPCMYYGYNSCTMGADCPYLHDPANKYNGPKPRGLREKGSSSHAGAATVIAATCLASEARPSTGATVSSLQARQQPMEDSSPVCSDRNRKHPFKGAIRNAKKACKSVMTSVSKKIQTVMC